MPKRVVVHCDVKGCPIELDEKSGFEIRSTVYCLDRSDRDADSLLLDRVACSHNHLVALLGQEEAEHKEFVSRFTTEGKKKRGAAE